MPNLLDLPIKQLLESADLFPMMGSPSSTVNSRIIKYTATTEYSLIPRIQLESARMEYLQTPKNTTREIVSSISVQMASGPSEAMKKVENDKIFLV